MVWARGRATGTAIAAGVGLVMIGAGEARPRASSGQAAVAWVDIPGGSFKMGSEDAGPDAQPRHEVRVRPFQMSKTLVTVRQYQACVDAGACTKPDAGGSCNWGAAGRERHPVNCVDWEQALAFARWAGGRLPSEAEWEYAARGAGQDRAYPWGNEEATCERAVINEGSPGCGRGSTWPVCSKPKGSTEQGLCDMAGNVWQWVQDGYHASYAGAPSDGSAWESPEGSRRVGRGGSWRFFAGFARSGRRCGNGPNARLGGLGFRLAR